MITYLKGDATAPTHTGTPRLIVHICNNVGGWGAGFVLAISNRWLEPEREYRHWFKNKFDLGAGTFRLGGIQVVAVEPDLAVVNMIAQEGYGRNNRNLHRTSEQDNRPPIRYDALETCLQEVSYLTKGGEYEGASVHMPRIGCGLAGGKWEEIEPIIQRTLPNNNVFVYDL